MNRTEQFKTESYITNNRIAPMEKADSQTSAKLQQIKSIMLEAQSPNVDQKQPQRGHKGPSHRKLSFFQRKRHAAKGQKRSGLKVGIFCFEDVDIGWLRAVLSSQNFVDKITEIKLDTIKEKGKLEQEASKNTFCICLFGNSTWENIVSPPWIDAINTLRGLRPLIVVVLDVEDNSERKKSWILQNVGYPGIGNQQIFFFSEAEKYAYIPHLNPKNQTELVLKGAVAGHEVQKKMNGFLSWGKRTYWAKKGNRPPLSSIVTSGQNRSMQPPISSPAHTQEDLSSKVSSPSYPQSIPAEEKHQSTRRQEPTRHVVGIFSRSSSDDYSWLVKQLTELFRNQIQEVRPCYISNNGFQHFLDDLTECTFGILYHTKNRGRLNITDVTDSLYDEELKYLSEMLGKDNVIVVIDDLEDSSEEERSRILANQPSIVGWASDLHLISFADKSNPRQLEEKLKSIKQFCHPSEVSGKRPHEQRSESDDTNRGNDIVIFSILEDSGADWLQKLLSSELFGRRRVTVQNISLHKYERLREIALPCKLGVIYHSMTRGWPSRTDGKYLYNTVLQQLSADLGKDNVIVVIDDLKDSSEEETWRILTNENGIKYWASDVYLISHAEKSYSMLLERRLMSIKQFCCPSESLEKRPRKPESRKNNCDIVIFSILEDSSIDWLQNLLSSEIFGHRRVTMQKISLHKYERETAMQCKLGVIYHSMRSGWPTTREGDFLYYGVLRQLSGNLGRDNVVVIIDDLQGDDYNTKKRVMETQSYIDKLVGDVCLILQEDKENKMKLVDKLKTVKQFCYASEFPHIADLPPNQWKGRLGGGSNLQQSRDTYCKKTLTSPRPVIGIFSVSEEGHVHWLRRLLSSNSFGQRKTIYHKMSSYDDVGIKEGELRCTVAVLHHSMNKGPPVTRKSEFLYDKVADQLVRELGEDNVIVMIDDVQHNRDKDWGERFWPRFRTEMWAKNLIYIFEEEKQDEIQLIQKLKNVKLFLQPPEYPHITDLPPNQRKGRRGGGSNLQQSQNTYCKKTLTSPRPVVGIVSVSDEGRVHWLRRLLSSNSFGQRETIYHKMSSFDNVGIKDGELRCTVAVLHHSMNRGPPVTRGWKFLYDKVYDQLVRELGEDNIIVMIDDVQHNRDKDWGERFWPLFRTEMWAKNLIYIFEEEKYDEIQLIQKLKNVKLFLQPPAFCTKTNSTSETQTIQPTTGSLNTKSSPASSVIGIFSCSEQSKFKWLGRLLSSEEFGNHEVLFHQINPNDIKRFQSMVSRSKFGILYHCVDRGFRHLTDHENSLYDKELRYLSSKIGKHRMIVVVDEVGNSDEEAKCWYLEKQPSLETLARDILLFNTLEKAHHDKPSRSTDVDRKLDRLKEILREETTPASFSSSEGVLF